MTAKKICFFLGSVSGKGGSERVSLGLANHLAEQGYAVTVISLYEGKNPFFKLHSAIKTVELFEKNQSFTKLFFGIVFKLKKLINENCFDVFISVETILCMYSVPAFFISKPVKRIAWEHFNSEVNFGLKVRKWARNLAARFSNKVVVLTKRDKELWENNFKTHNNVICIPNAASIENINVTDYNTREKLVIAVGRLTYQKGFDMLLKAWAQIFDKVKDWKLCIVGSGEDETMLRDLIEQQSLKNISIEAATNQIHEYYNKASLFCMSSRFEGLPMVLIEAQYFGLPIVSFDCNTGPAEVVTHSENGFLCEANNINVFALSLKKCILNEEERKQFHISALQSAKRFQSEPIYAMWRELLERL